jgi:succinate dehydrogenase hydrophobic anchor subunit
MENDIMPESPTPLERQEAHDYAVQRLAAISAAIWAIGVIVFMVVVFPQGTFKPSIGMMVGAWLLVPAALPWLAYNWLVERALRQRRRDHDAAQ